MYHGACLAPLYDIVWKKNKGGGTKDNRAVMTAVEALRFTGACWLLLTHTGSWRTHSADSSLPVQT